VGLRLVEGFALGHQQLKSKEPGLLGVLGALRGTLLEGDAL